MKFARTYWAVVVASCMCSFAVLHTACGTPIAEKKLAESSKQAEAKTPDVVVPTVEKSTVEKPAEKQAATVVAAKEPEA